MPANTQPLGPGLLTIGDVAAATDISCQVTAARITWEKDADDDLDVLCGEVVPGEIRYTASLTGTLFQDYSSAAAIGQYTWENKGQQVPFTFVPSNVWAQEATGILTVDPIDFGGDEVKAKMTSDFEWAIVGDPVLGAVTARDATEAEADTRDPVGV
jgi:hypothetical protein